MSVDWESRFGFWALSPSQTETTRCENAVKGVRNAVNASPELNTRSIHVFAQGSYRNRVNVRADSDVDVGVLCDEVFHARYPEGKGHADYGFSDATYTYGEFKDALGRALVSHFKNGTVSRGKKAFDVKATSYHVEADVVPLFEYRHYYDDGGLVCGTCLKPDPGFSTVDNYPERLLNSWPHRGLHYENGVKKNQNTSRRYKGVVRIVKALRNEMAEDGVAAAIPIPGFLIECLVWNCPDFCFSYDTWVKRVRSVFAHLWGAIDSDEKCQRNDAWLEINQVKYLFHWAQNWTRAQAFAFVDEAWKRIGITE